ncbi:MAG: monovalent cation:H+ antiporter-2, family [Campylobacterota bacterium]|nr:monovalent cation:H+ antiporter-2, family [Campylobacterota bacterium]
MENTMLILIVAVAIATVLNVLLKKFHIPTVIGYIFSGFALSAIFHFGKESRDTLSHLAEFGIVFLLFTIGLEFSISHLRNMKKEVFVFGGLEVILLGLLFTALGYWLMGLEIKSAIVIGFALSLSSTAIVLKVLNETHDIHSGYGRIAVGILLFQDLAVIPILLMVSFFASETASIGTMLLQTLIGAIVIFFIIFLAGKYFLEPFFDWITSSDSEEIFLGAVLLIVISASVLAEVFGFSYSLGAFLIGMTLAETKYRYRIEANLIPFRDILLGVFFVTIGMQIDWHSFIYYGYEIVGLLMGIILLKGFLIFGVLQFFVQRRSALKASLALFQVGEFSLAIFALANGMQLIGHELNQILIITVALSMIITPFVLKNIKIISNALTKEPETLRERALAGGTYEGHLIVCGYGPLGQKLVETFREKGLLYVILEHDVKIVDAAIAKGEKRIFLANAAQKMVLEHFNVVDSAAIIVAIENEIQRQLICENIISFGAHINSIVKVNNVSEEEVIASLGIRHIVNSREIITDMLTQKALTCQLNYTKE